VGKRGMPGPPGSAGFAGNQGIFTTDDSNVFYYTKSSGGLVPSYNTPFILGNDEQNPSDAPYLQYNPNGNLFMGTNLRSSSGKNSMIYGSGNTLGGDNNITNGNGNTYTGSNSIALGKDNIAHLTNSIVNGESNTDTDLVNSILCGDNCDTNNVAVYNSIINGYKISVRNNNTAVLASHDITLNGSESAVLGSHDITLNRNNTVYTSQFVNWGSYQTDINIVSSPIINVSPNAHKYIMESDEDMAINLEGGSSDLDGIRHRFIFKANSNSTVTINTKGDDTMNDIFDKSDVKSINIDTESYFMIELQYNSDEKKWFTFDVARTTPGST
jgi:hypothetical protein